MHIQIMPHTFMLAVLFLMQPTTQGVHKAGAPLEIRLLHTTCATISLPGTGSFKGSAPPSYHMEIKGDRSGLVDLNSVFYSGSMGL